MALVSYKAVIRPVEPFAGAAGPDPSMEIAAQAALLASAVTSLNTAKTSTATAVTSATTADTNTGTAQTSVNTAQTNTNTAKAATATAAGNFASRTATQAAVDVLVADGALPTQAHVNDLVTAWNTFKTNLTTHETSVTTADTNTGTAQTSVNTAKTNTDTAKTSTATALTNTTTADTNTGSAVTSLSNVTLVAAAASVAYDVALFFNAATVVTRNKFREAVRAILRVIEGDNSLSGS